MRHDGAKVLQVVAAEAVVYPKPHPTLILSLSYDCLQLLLEGGAEDELGGASGLRRLLCKMGLMFRALLALTDPAAP